VVRGVAFRLSGGLICSPSFGFRTAAVLSARVDVRRVLFAIAPKCMADRGECLRVSDSLGLKMTVNVCVNIWGLFVGLD
jgi:hypothetical protein